MTPFFVAVVPIIVCLVGLIFSVQWLGSVLELSTSLIFWLPIMNPLFSMCFVKAYRRAIVGNDAYLESLK
ncbi:hypothetical protein AAVH_19476 [Aphelenchoides avenae]|nr:hypothetical protein AAVH_19476 [Aphelenchus avenae]